MEKTEEDAVKKQVLNINNIPRCPKCNIKSSHKLNYREGKPMTLTYD